MKDCYVEECLDCGAVGSMLDEPCTPEPKAEPPELCKCGHFAQQHIYGEGKCRSGIVVCPCDKFRPEHEPKASPSLEDAAREYAEKHYDKPCSEVVAFFARQQEPRIRRDAVAEFVQRVADKHSNGGSLGYSDAMREVQEEMLDEK